MMRIVRRRTIDPTTVRMSEHFLLSDFMGCSSVYSKGYANVFSDPTGEKLAEGKHLCETLLEGLLEDYGPLSISYGYISPELSRRVVSYQNPDIPSYHRWDKGAAADVCVHSWVGGKKKKPPIKLAHKIDEDYAYSRMITYSESPFICVGTQLNEGDKPRKAFYENRYMGAAKKRPLYIRKNGNRVQEGRTLELEHDWEGAGYPTYHGGGIKQWHHRRASKYSMVSDFLFNRDCVRQGTHNIPSKKNPPELFYEAGALYDYLLAQLSTPKMSIVHGFESFRISDDAWTDHYRFSVIPPEYVDVQDVYDAAMDSGRVSAAGVNTATREVTFVGKPL